jgi:sulfate adenylyltransferase
VAVCSPIAPFDATRQDVRTMTEAAGGAFFLVHVATPLEECERRDRKGLYAKARRGEIPEFTGISSPYEEPADADLRIDTTGRSIEECRDEVLAALVKAGYVSNPSLVEPGEPVSRPNLPSSVDPSQGPIRVLFVCTANICRSPYLELRARQLLGPDSGVEVSSAGTHGWDAEKASDTMAAEYARHGTDASAFRSRSATGDLVDAADLVLTAEAEHRTRLLEDRPAAFRKVFTLGQFVASARAADPTLHGRDLIAALAQRRVPASPEHDIADPYRRGPEAAARAAAQMEDLLAVVVERLGGGRTGSHRT